MTVAHNSSQSPKSNSKVVEGREVHKNLSSKRSLQMTSNVATKRKRVGGGRAKADESESLSDIDDSEVAGYLNNKEERRYKTIIWEKLNQQFAMMQALAKKQKKEAETKKKEAEAKKNKPGKGTAKNTMTEENKMRSSKIDYEALKKLTDELNQGVEDAETSEGLRSLVDGNDGSNAGNARVHEYGNSDADDLQEDNQFDDADDYPSRGYNYELYDEYEDGCYNADYDDC